MPRRRYLLAFSAATVAFIVAMSVAWQLAALSPRARTAPERIPGAQTTVAVLPFASFGTGREYFGEGVAEDIATALAKFHGLAVIAPNSSFRYRDGEHDAVRAGKALGARYVLTGSVRQDVANAHIRAALVDTANGMHVWSERIDWPVKGFFEAQFDIVDRVADRLTAKPNRVRVAGGRRLPDASLASYDRYLLARQLLRRRVEVDRPGTAVLASRRLLERAVAEQPDFAPYYAELSETYRAAFAERMRHPTLDGEFGSRVVIERAFQLASRAVSLDAKSPAAWAQLGWVLRWRSPLEDSIAAFERARALDPNFADARAGEPLVLAGRAVEAVPVIERAMRLDPLAPPETIASLGHAYYLLGDYGNAIDVLAGCVQRAPRFAFCRRMLAAAYSETGRREEAARHAREAMRDSPGWTIGAVARAGLYRRGEDLDRVVTGYRKAGFPE